MPPTQRIAIGIGAGIVLIGAVVLTLGTQWAPPGPVNAPRPAAAGEQPTAFPGAGSGTPAASPPTVATSDGSPLPSGSASSGPATMPPTTGPVQNGPSPQPLQASFSKVAGMQTLVGYRATVTVTNPGPVAATGWTITVTLPRETMTMSDVDGASAGRTGAKWTLTPVTATTTVPAGGSVSVTFQVNGAAVLDATPTACTVDGRACAGL